MASEGVSLNSMSCPTRVVLGIDAAWTTQNPSGVALVANYEGRWCLLCVDHSYSNFVQRAGGGRFEERPPTGVAPNARSLLDTAHAIANHPVDLVTIDIPLSRQPIFGRRVSDNCISSHFGACGCGTHTPNENRPGKVSEMLRNDFSAAGYPLITEYNYTGELRGIAEVYPHPALLSLVDCNYRLPYKCSKVRSYWPGAEPCSRRENLRGIWEKIINSFSNCQGPHIDGVHEQIRPDFSNFGTRAKAFEDKIDAVVCAWVGVCLLEGLAEPFGDHESAIWVPKKSISKE
jgi:predicted RNase H-like nuclease